MVKIAVDAGHGLNTPGKRTPDDEREWSFNKVVAESAIKYLKDYEGVKTIRLDDPSGKRDVPLEERTDKANREKADAMVSCHHNANTGIWGNWTGTETYTHTQAFSESEKIAKVVHKHVLKAYGLRDRGLKKANFHMLRETNMPSILIEGGFMDSTIDVKKMRDIKVLENAGKAIAIGLAEHFKLKKKPKSKPSTDKPKSDNLYKVQIGAFGNKKNADNLAKKAKSKGFDQYIVKEKGLYKVQIGAFSKKSNANVLADKAKKAGFDVYIEGATKSASKSNPKPKVLRVGQKVKIKSSAKNYVRTPKTVAIPARVKGKSYTIERVLGNDVLLKEIKSWVRKADVS